MPNSEPPIVTTLRRLMQVLFAVGTLGAIADLILLEHYEDTSQWIPFVLLAVGLVALVARAVGRALLTLRLFRVAMVALVAGGLVGLWLHYRANIEFELEVSPAMSGLTLFWKAIRGASPPSAAPATLVYLGLLGLISTYAQPALQRAGESPQGDQ